MNFKRTIKYKFSIKQFIFKKKTWRKATTRDNRNMSWKIMTRDDRLMSWKIMTRDDRNMSWKAVLLIFGGKTPTK